jgi:transcription initiation factor TFIID subunit 6
VASFCLKTLVLRASATAQQKDFTHLSAQSVQTIAEAFGIVISDDVAKALAPDVEYRLRDIIQEALKVTKRSRRTVLTTEDINAALRIRMCEPLYGFPSNMPSQEFIKVKGTNDLFYTYDEELDVNELLSEPLPPPSIAINVVPHWLAIEGVQPLIPENPSLDSQIYYQQQAKEKEETLAKAKAKKPTVTGPPPHPSAADGAEKAGDEGGEKKEGDAQQQQQQQQKEHGKFAPVVQHVLSRELQVYFDRITALLRGGGGANDEEQGLLNAAIGSLQTDAGLANLIPYFAKFISTEVQTNLRNLRKLLAMMRAIGALVENPDANLELYLHQLMPSVLTCIVAKRLSENPEKDNHWRLRVLASKTVAEICERYGEEYATLQPRVTATLQKGLKATQSPLPTIFGALVGLSSLGPRVIETVVCPELDRIVQRAEDILSSTEKTILAIGRKNEQNLTEEERRNREEKMYERLCAEKVLEAVELATDVLHERELAEQREVAKRSALQNRVGRMLAEVREAKRKEAEEAIRRPSAGELPPIIKEALKDEAKETRKRLEAAVKKEEKEEDGVKEEEEEEPVAEKKTTKASTKSPTAAEKKKKEAEEKKKAEAEAAAASKKRKAKSKSPTPPPPAPPARGGRSSRRAASKPPEEEVKPPPAKRTRRGGR